MSRIGEEPHKGEGRRRLQKEIENHVVNARITRRLRACAHTPQVICEMIPNYSVPNLTHDVKVPPDVVTRRQCRVQNLPGLEQVAQVRSE